MLMKKLIFSFMMLAMGLYAQAQQLDVCTKPYGDDGSEITVIKPTVANFLLLLSMNEEQFKAVMEANKYSTQMPRGNFISYWNGNPDNFQFAKCVNSFLLNKETKEVHFAVGNDMIYPQGSIMALYRELQPYRKEGADNARPGFPTPPTAQPGQATPPTAQPGQATPPTARPGEGFGQGPRPGAGPRRGRMGRGRGGMGRGGALGRTRTDTFEVKSDDGSVYTFSIGAFPRFFYVTAKKQEAAK